MVHHVSGDLTSRSPDNKLLTATMKLNRPDIAKQFAKEIEVCYCRLSCSLLTRQARIWQIAVGAMRWIDSSSGA